ncbi:uncharacterized protein LOC126467491 [Schistocerca serialis cubense]|uniref:uncharacterized protein LOC126467491 n=1 Tax=Schistocerca serialis cubense TaxID=2023355 RepID=UPI00214EE0AD|nr:uncharacterized protein LOC126467491 [Schistocerca serialis cubense]
MAQIEEDDGIYRGDSREEADVLFVRRGLQNSAESLMDQPGWQCFCPEDVFPQPGERAPLMGDYDDDDEYEEVAERMVRSPAVYRTLCTPKGGLDFPDGVRYSIRGRLCHFGVMGYQFKPDTPLLQTWGWSDGELVRLYSSRPVRAVDLQREYFNASDVARGDVTEEPLGPVLNSDSMHD